MATHFGYKTWIVLVEFSNVQVNLGALNNEENKFLFVREENNKLINE